MADLEGLDDNLVEHVADEMDVNRRLAVRAIKALDGVPWRGSVIEAWIKRARDQYPPDDGYYTALDILLDEYREAADTGIHLDRRSGG